LATTSPLEEGLSDQPAANPDLEPSTAIAEAARLRTRFERLLNASVSIFAQHTLGGVLQEVVDAALGVVGARYAALGVLAEDGVSLQTFVTAGLSAAERERIGALPVGRGLLGLLIREPKPVRVADIRRHPASFGFPAHHPGMKTFLGVPIMGRRGVYGNLYLTEKVGAAEFDAEDEAIAVFLATKAGVAIENARLYEHGQELLAQVQALQRQRELFFSMMNHELRNALTGVYGWAERLVRVKASPENRELAAREVFEGAEQTISLLTNLLDFTRLDTGKVRPVLRDVDPREAVHRSFVAVQPAADAKGVVLEARCPPDLPTIRTDPVRLQQILMNLLSNAIRHSPGGATVTVESACPGTTLEMRVVDRGPGMTADQLRHLFEPFERFDPHSGVGSGLGLAVSRRLADVLGGDLRVESEPGAGATFTLRLPAGASGD
jgi:signal transduction histidine kinase